ncbi:50S ribosomal protein L3, putative [Eimeria mitis]|uniref:Large ribosomal subunit protein uL3c n=1 Tax=Eimeria mitis TaxID=44415 RepID=U6K1F3_9EIME|nr:50S ribosomal protein L3, putative [Eimeria mitis]CDJ31560.1 50S ribosomal protein L3, putative [Eimeria mitis]
MQLPPVTHKKQHQVLLQHSLLLLLLLLLLLPGSSCSALAHHIKTRRGIDVPAFLLSHPSSLSCSSSSTGCCFGEGGFECAAQQQHQRGSLHNQACCGRSSRSSNDRRPSGETRLWVRKFLNLRDPEEPRPDVEEVAWKDMKPKFLNLRDPEEPRPDVEEVAWKDMKPKVEVLALKVGMTSLFASDGTTEAATLLQVIPATIVQFLEYGKALVAFEDPLHNHRFLRRSVLGVLQRVGSSGSATSTAGARSSGSCGSSTMAAVYAQPAADYVLGQIIDASALVGAARVTIKGRPKKKGFEGVMQRHGFKGGPATHGSKHHRGPGSVGAGTDPGRVLPGTRMAGRDPKQSSTVRDLLLLGFNLKTNSLLVKGAVPGHPGKTIVKVLWDRAREQEKELRQRLKKAAADEFVEQKKGRPTG